MKILTLVLHTFRELIAKATLIILASISTLIILLTLFGISSLLTQELSPGPEELETIVLQMQGGFASGLFTGILLFGVFATAGIIPDTMEKGTIDLYLSKPLARWELVAGKFLGGIAVILANIAYFLGALWLIIGLRVGIWNGALLSSIGTITLAYACAFAGTLTLGIIFRNTAIPIIGTFLYVFVLERILHSREHILYVFSDNAIYRAVIDGLHAILPQLSGMQEGFTRQILHQPVVWDPFMQSVITSLAILAVGLVVFQRRDF